MEIYNEQLRDLLAPSSEAAQAEGLRRFGGGKTGAVSMRPSSKGSAAAKLSIKDDAVRGVRVAGLRTDGMDGATTRPSKQPTRVLPHPCHA